MARIKWISHPTDPSKNQTFEHVSREVAAIVCSDAFKQAEPAPYKNYIDRLNAVEAERAQTEPPAADEWGVLELLRDMPKISFKNGRTQETFHYDCPPPNCPPAIAQRWQNNVDLLKASEAAPEIKVKAMREQESRDRADRTKQIVTLMTGRV